MAAERLRHDHGLTVVDLTIRVERHEGHTSFRMRLEFRHGSLFLVIEGKVIMPIIPDDFVETFNRLVREGVNINCRNGEPLR